MYLTDPFNLSSCIAMVEIDGVSSLGLSKGHHHPLNTDQSESKAFETLQKRIDEHNPNSDSKLVYIDLSDGLNAVSITIIC